MKQMNNNNNEVQTLLNSILCEILDELKKSNGNPKEMQRENPN